MPSRHSQSHIKSHQTQLFKFSLLFTDTDVVNFQLRADVVCAVVSTACHHESPVYSPWLLQRPLPSSTPSAPPLGGVCVRACMSLCVAARHGSERVRVCFSHCVCACVSVCVCVWMTLSVHRCLCSCRAFHAQKHPSKVFPRPFCDPTTHCFKLNPWCASMKLTLG